MRVFRKFRQLLDVDWDNIGDGDALVRDGDTITGGTAGGGGGAPTDATYITQTANGDLDNEQALSALSTGLVKVTNGTGVLSTATGGTDYANASHQHAGEDITSGTVADARIASTIARDSEVTSAISALSSVYQAKDTTLDTYAGIDPSSNVQSVLSAADYAAMRTLLSLGALATGDDASDVPVTDSGANYTATDVEGVLAEIAPQLGGGGGGVELLGYAQWTTAEIVLGTNTVICTAPPVTLDGSTNVVVEMFAPQWAGTKTVSISLWAAVDGGSAASLGNVYYGSNIGSYAGNGALTIRVPFASTSVLSSGSYVFSFRGTSTGASVYAGSGGSGNFMPGRIIVTSLPAAS